MKKQILVLVLLLTGLLAAQFYDPIQVNEDLNPVFYRGNNACKIIGGEVFLTFVEDSLAANLYFSYSSNGLDFTNYLLDENIYWNKAANPCLEVLPNGNIYIFYIKEDNDVLILNQAKSINNGLSFNIFTLEENVSSFTSTSDDDDLYLAYHQEDDVNLSYFSHFTNVEEYENGENARFWGPDVLYGPVHSNDDIWIMHAGGGPNSNRPTFNGLVTTTGRARYFNGVPYKEAFPTTWHEVFRGGLKESVDGVQEMDLFDASELRANAMWIGNGHDIVYMKINGSAIQLMYGDIVNLGQQEFEAYSWYPSNNSEAMNVINQGGNWFEDSDNIWTNQITIYDTIWTAGGALSFGNTTTLWVNDAKLWIEGQVSNKLTVGCADDIYIVNDITYTNTAVGDYPDGFSGIDPFTGQMMFEGAANETDYFGLVSEQKIYIKYKHRDPFDDFCLVNANCNGVYLYGSYATLAYGDPGLYGTNAPHYDGVFTFEYQHGHGSTPSFESVSPYTGNDTIYTYINLHKYIFPSDPNIPPVINGFVLHGNNPIAPNMVCGFPYESEAYMQSYPNNGPNYEIPYGTDYPWYNPVWPESSDNIVWERGIIHLYGSLAQRRRGYVHRSGGDPSSHTTNHEWDLENFHYDGTHPSSGYDKDYFYDHRLAYNSPYLFPSGSGGNIYGSVKIIKSENENNFYLVTSKTESNVLQDLFIAAKDEIMILASVFENSMQIQSYNFGNYGASMFVNDPDIEIRNMILNDEKAYFLAYSTGDYQNKIYQVDPIYMEWTEYKTFFPNESICDFEITNDDSRIYAYLHDMIGDEMEVKFKYTEGLSNNFENIYLWQTSFSLNEDNDSRIYIDMNLQDSVYVSILNSISNDVAYGDLFLAKGKLPELTGIEDYEIPLNLESTLSNYPNPFNPSTTISFSVPQTSSFVTLEIYNLKGQKVKNLSPSLRSMSSRAESRDEGRGENQYKVVWNGTNDSGKPVSSGIYFYKLKSGDFQKTKKMLLMK